MLIHPLLDKLSKEIAQRRNRAIHTMKRPAQFSSERSEPFILFLGTGCAAAAGVPSINKIATQVLELYARDNMLKNYSISKEEISDPHKALAAFYNILQSMSQKQLVRLLQSYYINLTVPIFYQDLALLIKARYFQTILTTNFDNLLEQALNIAGLQHAIHYQTNSLGINESNSSSYNSTVATYNNERWFDEPIQIIKLHGDLVQQDVKVLPEQIENALKSQRKFINRELKGDIIMLGYEFVNNLPEDRHNPIEDWLSNYRRDSIWMIDQQKTEVTLARQWAEQVFYIDGETANPKVFFSQLALRLLRQPMLESLSKSYQDIPENYNDNPTSPEQQINIRPIDDKLETEDIVGRIRQLQTVLFSLEQSPGLGKRDVQTQAQIYYQRRQIIELEDKRRNIWQCKKRLLFIIKRILTTINLNTTMDKSTIRFLKDLLRAIEKDYNNQHIVSASISAVIRLADRVNIETGTTVVDDSLIRELASLVPSLSGGGYYSS